MSATHYSFIPSFHGAFIFFILSITFFIFSLLLPATEIDALSDLGNYYWFWKNLDTSSLGSIFIDFSYEPGFVLFSKFLSYFCTFSTFLWTIKFLVFYSFFLFALRLNKNILLVLFLSLIIFFFFPPFDSIANLVIRQGLATALLFFYFSIIDIKNIRLKNILFLSALLTCFHYSAIFVAIALILSLYINGKYSFLIWCIASFLYIFNFPAMLGMLVYENLGSTVHTLSIDIHKDNIEYVIGFKPIFLFVSTFPFIVSLILSFSGMLTIRIKELLAFPLFRFYFILNSMCAFTSLIPYHDRYFIWSWVLSPLLIIFSLNFFRYTVKFH
jgi:hypothetical protein